jgi:uncharacterized lipoprotein YddW (UPF0748 family)
MKSVFVVAILLALVVSLGQAQEFRAFWCDAWHAGYENPTATQSMVSYVGACNANVVIAEVRKRGDAYYASTLEPVGINMTPQTGYDCLGDIVAKAHAAGQEAHAWVVTYRVWTFTTPPAQTSPNHVFNTHPEWFNLTNTGAKFDGSNNSFLDPGHPEVENWNAAVFSEIIRDYDVDAIHLDYIRYPGTTWGYNPVSVARYNAEYGTTGNPATTDSRWSNWRRDQITNMVKRVYLEAKAIKPTIKVGASVWKTSPTGNSGYFQNYDLWMSRHWLDYCCPMNYTTTNSTFDSNARDSLGRMYGRHIYMGQGAYMNTISNSMWQLADAQSLGFPGVTIYSYAVPNSGTVDRAAFQSALLSGPFATPQPVPAMDWITNPTLGMLKGFVKDAEGYAVYPATVTIAGDSTKNSGTGFYGFVDLAPGTYTVTATAPGQPQGSGVVNITAGLVASLDITLGATDTEAPSQPTNLAATPASETQVNLTWTASTDNVGVTGYKVYRDGAQIGTSATASYSDTNCSPNTTYSYEVSAYDAAGNESVKSAPAVATTPADTTPPSVPANLTATAVSSTRIDLSWDVSTDNIGVAGYNVYRDGVQIGTSGTTNFSDVTCSPSTTYTYEVSAYDAAGNESAKSAPASATTFAPPDTEAPSQPTNLTATAVSGTQVNLTWTASTDNVAVTGYKVFRDGVQIGTSVATSYSDTTCSPSTTYSYEVSAYDAAANESVRSAPAVVTTPGDTTPPVITSIVGTGVRSGFRIDWTTNEPATSQVEYGLTTSYGSMTTLDSNLVTSHSVTQTGLARKTTYHYRVRSRDAAGNEAVSSDRTVKTK